MDDMLHAHLSLSTRTLSLGSRYILEPFGILPSLKSQTYSVFSHKFPLRSNLRQVGCTRIKCSWLGYILALLGFC